MQNNNVRINLNVPPNVRRELKAYAAKEGKTMNEVINMLIEEYLTYKKE